MTNEQAKFILNAYRAGAKDSRDPTVAEALRMASLDPQLKRWLADEQAHSAAVSAKLREIAPPPDLRNAILAGARVSSEAERRSYWLRITGYAAAACLVGVVGFFGFASGPNKVTAPSGLAVYAVVDAHAVPHGTSGMLAHTARMELAEDDRHLGTDVPINLDALLADGCRTVDFEGRDVIEICFSRDGNRYHLYAARMTEFPADLKPGDVKQGRLDEMNYINFTCGELQYVIVSSAAMDALIRLL